MMEKKAKIGCLIDEAALDAACVDISDYRFDGKNYSGTIRYTVYDHFGLDDADISGERNWYKGAFEPFDAWYVLQHYKGCEGKYQPFVTYMNFEVPFSGSVGWGIR